MDDIKSIEVMKQAEEQGNMDWSFQSMIPIPVAVEMLYP